MRPTRRYPLVPDGCPFCRAPDRGGWREPGMPMLAGRPTYYQCGASIWIFHDFGDGTVQMIAKGCSREWDDDAQPLQL